MNSHGRRSPLNPSPERILALYYETLYDEPPFDFHMIDDEDEDDPTLWAITFFGEAVP
jgi:hypothetical protein